MQRVVNRNGKTNARSSRFKVPGSRFRKRQDMEFSRWNIEEIISLLLINVTI